MEKKLPLGKAEKHDPALHMEMETLRAEREQRIEAEEAQTEREKHIAEAHEVIGRVQALSFIGKVTTVSSLVQLNNIKESKAYRDLPGIGTWDKYCENLGLSRQKVDEDLRNLATFGEAFLTTCQQFSLGYREMRKLKQLTHEGAVIIEGECLRIGDESIPIDQEHADDLQTAIEQIITSNAETKKRLDKLEKDFKGALKEETHGLQTEKKALLERVKGLEQYEPAAHDDTWCEEQMKAISTNCTTLATSIATFIVDPRLNGDRAAQAAVLHHLTHAQNMLYDLRERFESAYSTGE